MQQMHEGKDKRKMEIGRLCVKLAGRDAGEECVVVDVLDNNNVLVDGNTRRKKCNIMHLEPLDQVLKIKKNTSHDEVISVMEKAGIKIIKKGSSRKKKEVKAEKKEIKEKPKKFKAKAKK